ncbi:MAG: DUF1552 domain-containing protein [Myxococcota bacterium]
MNQKELKARLTRRQLLCGVGGVSVALPLLSSLSARAQTPKPPRRLLLMYTPNGVISDAWWPTNVSSETAFDLNAIHQPLQPFRSRLTLLSGVDLSVSKQGPGGLHQRGIGGLFTGRKLQSGSQFVDGCGQTAGWADGISVDQALVRAAGAATLLPSLELGVRALDNDVQGRIAYAGAGQPLPPINNPLDAFNRLFSMLGASSAAMEALRQNRRSVLDTVQGQFAALAPRLGNDDRRKLDAHLELVRDVERRLTDVSSDRACNAPSAPPTLDPQNPYDMPLIADLELDMLAAAFACDLTRVASFQISTSLNRIAYPFLSSNTGEGHSLSHAGPSDTEAHKELVLRQTWHAGRLAHLLTRLEEIKELDGTSVLDNTLVVWGNEVAQGNTHSHENLPFLLVGGGWYFRTGRYLRYQAVPHNNLLVSVLNAMGQPVTTFGDPEYCTGALSGLV